MLAEISDFRCHVFSGGYQCKEIQRGDKRFRAVVQKEELGFFNERNPLQDSPLLHREFAGLDLTEEAFLSFADRWGLLHGDLNADDLGDLQEKTRGVSTHGDSTKDWFENITKMKGLVKLWDGLQKGSENDLSQLFELIPDEKGKSPEVRYKEFPDEICPIFYTDREWASFSSIFARGGIRQIARICFYDLFEELSSLGDLGPRLGFNRETGEPTLFLVPDDLENALWLSFAREILGKKNLRQCAFCKKSFDLLEGGKKRRPRSDKTFCSPKCRAAAFRGKALAEVQKREKVADDRGQLGSDQPSGEDAIKVQEERKMT